MKKRFLLLLTLSFVVLLSSCQKFDKKSDKITVKKKDYYYSKDFKDFDEEILGVDSQEIDALYSSFYYEGKVLLYKLVAESFDDNHDQKDNGKVLAYETGVAEVNDALEITFIPDANPDNTYTGTFESTKKSYSVFLSGVKNQELNFVLGK